MRRLFQVKTPTAALLSVGLTKAGLHGNSACGKRGRRVTATRRGGRRRLATAGRGGGVAQQELRWKSPPAHPAPSKAAEITNAAVQCLTYTIALSVL